VSTPPYTPPPEDPELTEEEAEGIRLSMEELDRGVKPIPSKQVFDELMEELDALDAVRQRRRTG
jgi:hypothetical protein